MRSQLLRITSFVATTGFLYLGASAILKVGPQAAAQRVESTTQHAQPAPQAEPAQPAKPKPQQAEPTRHAISPDRREELSKCLEHRREELREEKKARNGKKTEDAKKNEADKD
jgi:hypothetical protein